jgi:membrane associated rhomboid family serine protease
MYRGRDLSEGDLWRLPLSAFMSQSFAQCAWTLLMIATVFVAVERRIGTGNLVLVALASHVVSTVVVDLAAGMDDRAVWLTRLDYGTSCLIFGAVVALLCVTETRAGWAVLALVLAGDGLVNTRMTIAEHAVAVLTALVVMVCLRGSPALAYVREVARAAAARRTLSYAGANTRRGSST